MNRSDFLILSEVRRHLTRTQADPARIQFGVTRGVVYFAGEFSVRTGARELEGRKYFDLVTNTLLGLEKQLRRIPGVVDVFFRFSNMQKESGVWRHGRVRARSATGVYTIPIPGRGETTAENRPTSKKDEEES